MGRQGSHEDFNQQTLLPEVLPAAGEAIAFEVVECSDHGCAVPSELAGCVALVQPDEVASSMRAAPEVF